MRKHSAPITRLTAAFIATMGLSACKQTVWQAEYTNHTPAGRHYAKVSLADSEGNVFVGGASTAAIVNDPQGNPIISFQPTLLKYDPAGNLLWEFHYDNGQRRGEAQRPRAHRNYDYEGGAQFSHVLQGRDGHVYAGGVVYGNDFATNHFDYDVAVFKLDSTGKPVWQRVIKQPSMDSLLGMSLDEKGDLVVAVGKFAAPFSDASVDILRVYALNGNNHNSFNVPEMGNDSLVDFSDYADIAQFNNVIFGKDRVAVASELHGVSVFSLNGTLLYKVEPPSIPSRSKLARGPYPWGFANNVGMQFVGRDLLMVHQAGTGLIGSYAEAALSRFDEKGNLLWSTPLPDLAVNWDSDTAPAINRATYVDAKLVINGNRVYVGTTAVTQMNTKDWSILGVDMDAAVFAVSLSGEVVWSRFFESLFVPTSQIMQPSEWNIISDLGLGANGNPVIALNKLKLTRSPYSLFTDEEITLGSVSSQLVELNAQSGGANALGVQFGQLIRSIASAPVGMFKVSDDFTYLPLWNSTYPKDMTPAESRLYLHQYLAK